MLPRHSVGTYQGNELTRNSSGNSRQQSFQLAELLWTDPGLKSGMVCASYSPLKQPKQGARGKRIVEPFSKILSCEENASTTTIFHTGLPGTFQRRALLLAESGVCQTQYLPCFTTPASNTSTFIHQRPRIQQTSRRPNAMHRRTRLHVPGLIVSMVHFTRYVPEQSITR